MHKHVFKPLCSGQSGLNTYTSPPFALTGARFMQTSGKFSNIFQIVDKDKEFVTNAQPALIAMFTSSIISH